MPEMLRQIGSQVDVDAEFRYLVTAHAAAHRQLSESMEGIRTLLALRGCLVSQGELRSLLAEMSRDMQPEEIAGVAVDDLIAGLRG